jgi:hypothetical protein
MNEKKFEKTMGIILIIMSFILPIVSVLSNIKLTLDYGFGFSMGALLMTGIMMFI